MRRTPLQRRTPLARSSGLSRGAPFAAAMPLARTAELKRTPMKRSRRKPRKSDDPRYLSYVRTLPCCVGPRFGRCRRRVDPHHMTGGKGADRRGKSQKVDDRKTLPLCRRHHDDFHAGRGVFAGWSTDERRVFQEDEIARLNKMFDEHEALGVWQEPERIAV